MIVVSSSFCSAVTCSAVSSDISACPDFPEEVSFAGAASALSFSFLEESVFSESFWSLSLFFPSFLSLSSFTFTSEASLPEVWSEPLASFLESVSLDSASLDSVLESEESSETASAEESDFCSFSSVLTASASSFSSSFSASESEESFPSSFSVCSSATACEAPEAEPSAVSEALAPIGKISAMIIIKAIITARTLDDFLVSLLCLLFFTTNPPTACYIFSCMYCRNHYAKHQINKFKYHIIYSRNKRKTWCILCNQPPMSSGSKNAKLQSNDQLYTYGNLFFYKFS